MGTYKLSEARTHIDVNCGEEMVVKEVTIKRVEAIVTSIICNSSTPLTLDEVLTLLRRKGIDKTRESLIKILALLVAKGIVERIEKGFYVCSHRQTTLDMFVKPVVKEKPVEYADTSRPTGHEFLEMVKKVVPIRNIVVFKKVDVRDLIIGGSAGDDSSRPIKPGTIFNATTFVRVSARVRLGCIERMNIIMSSDDMPRVDPEEDSKKIIPEHVLRGGIAEFITQGIKSSRREGFTTTMKPRYVRLPFVFRDIDYETASFIAKKLSEYDFVDFQLEVIEHTLAEAKYKATSSDIAIAFIDGSILPGHLDPTIYPDSKSLEEKLKDYPDLLKIILDRKEAFLRKFIRIYEDVRDSNVVLIGTIKESKDKTLQVLSKVYSDVSDQELLASAGLENTILGSFTKHRAIDALVKELSKFNLKLRDEVKIDSYYVFRYPNALPLQLDIVFPKNVPEDLRDTILWLLYHLTIPSEFHTKESDKGYHILTLIPINIVDTEARKWSSQIATIIEKELSDKLYSVMLELSYLPIDFAIFIYNSHLNQLTRVR
jgi:Fe2+ or Zn2+ uptake regulation protein